MPFHIIRDDISRVHADAIVNTANPQPIIGQGVDSTLHRAAGPALLEARKKLGEIPVGEARITPAFSLPANHVIHTVGPVWQDGLHRETSRLESCYVNCLRLARKYKCTSIAFPLISSGTYAFPKELALKTAIRVFSRFLEKHEMEITLVVFDRESFHLSNWLFDDVQSYIDEHFVDERETMLREKVEHRRRRMLEAAVCDDECREPDASAFSAPQPLAAAAKRKSISPAKSLDELLAHTDAGFSETLMRLIDQSGSKDAVIYNRANISRQHFSKIRSNPQYKPTKATALAFAIALRLDLEQTRDLIGRAGYALTNSSKSDVILQYFIEQGIYDLFEINAALFKFDQPLLGA